MNIPDSVSRPASELHTAATSAMVSNSQLLSANTQVVIGAHKCEILEHLAEGGFANIYKVRFIELTNEMEAGMEIRQLQPGEIACLKRVVVPDENGLNELRNEVETMKQLRGCPNIVQYYDSNASRLQDGSQGYEIMLLMELCPKNSLLDYMNQKLATKLTEAEILKILYDVTNAVAQMHYLPRSLIHRDIKIENVLVDKDDNFKLCDFGSTSLCFPIVSTHQDISVLTNNIYVHTTPQYRSPEMIDLYRCLPINEKSDIWALGIFLYKLLFYTTPFELTGQFAILHSKYEFPQNNYSSKLINLIIIMLAENPSLRPNIYQVMHHVCSILKCDVPFPDKYELGPYDFAKYSAYHLRVQQVQYQMFELYAKDKLTTEDIDTLNNLFMQNFEIAPKQPVGHSVSSKRQINGPEDLEADIAKMDEYYPTVETLESGNAREKGAYQLQSGAEVSVKKSESKSTSDVSNKSQTSLVSNDLHELKGNAKTPPPQQLNQPPLPQANQQQNTAAARQHKQYNPFQAQYQPDLNSSNFFHADNEQLFKGTPPGHSRNDKQVSYFQQTSIRENKDIQASVQQAEHIPKFDPNVGLPDRRQGSIAKEEFLIDLSAPTTSIPFSNQSPVLAVLDQNMNVPSAPQQLQQLTLQQLHQKTAGQQQVIPPPPQPRLDLTFDQFDLSKNSLTRQSDTEVEESIISDESISLDLKQPKKKKDTPILSHSSGSINLDNKEFRKPSVAKAPQRKSLDLKYQEINLSSDDQRKHHKNKSFSRNSIRRSVELERERERMKYDSSAAASATSNNNSTPTRDEVKESKRRSFFGVFK